MTNLFLLRCRVYRGVQALQLEDRLDYFAASEPVLAPKQPNSQLSLIQVLEQVFSAINNV